jgi:hypothetical protein
VLIHTIIFVVNDLHTDGFSTPATNDKASFAVMMVAAIS